MSKVRASYLKNERTAISVLHDLLREGRQKSKRAEKQKDATTLRERRVERNSEGPKKPGFSKSAEVERIDSTIPAFIGDATLEENRTLARGNIATVRLQAEKGLASAQYNLGRMYELGIKLPTDKKLAMEWYEKSAKQHYPDAEYRIGISLLYGTGVKLNESAGKKWLALAAKHGHAVAKNMMDEIQSHSGSSQQSISLAVRWYLERAVVDDGQSAFHLGKIYEHGWGVRRDFVEAVKWYRRAAQAGNKEADKLADSLQSRLSEQDSMAEQNWLGLMLEQNGLPSWLSHPMVLISIGVVLFWPLFPWSKKARRKKAREAALKEAALKKIGQS
jgi:TPR repeat protein